MDIIQLYWFLLLKFCACLLIHRQPALLFPIGEQEAVMANTGAGAERLNWRGVLQPCWLGIFKQEPHFIEWKLLISATKVTTFTPAQVI